MDTKKFLDQDGISYLWSKLKNTFYNESDLQTAVNVIDEDKANIDSPNFIGIPTAPTADLSDSSNQIATTEFVQDLLYSSGFDTNNIFYLSYIKIINPPNKTVYNVEDIFDPTGMKVVAVFNDKYMTEIDDYNYTLKEKELTEDDSSIIISYSFNNIEKTCEQKITVSDNIYGVSWDGTSTTKWTRINAAKDFSDPIPYIDGAEEYSSPFDDIMPWSGMVRTTDSTAGELVAIPKFWYKLSYNNNGKGLTIQICNHFLEGFSVSPAHIDRGDGFGERDIIYTSRYFCNSSYKSVTGASPTVSITRTNFRINIHNKKNTMWQFDFATLFTIQLLYLVEFANWDSQNCIGYGCSASTTVQNTGASDSMPYHTGTMQTSRDTYGIGVQYRYIEDLWGNIKYWVDGCYYSNAQLYGILNPSLFDNASNGILIGSPSSGYPIAFTITSSLGFPIFYPSTSEDDNNSDYTTDKWTYDNSCLMRGGSYSSSSKSTSIGLFSCNCQGSSASYSNVGSRSIVLPTT